MFGTVGRPLLNMNLQPEFVVYTQGETLQLSCCCYCDRLFFHQCLTGCDLNSKSSYRVKHDISATCAKQSGFIPLSIFLP